MCGVRMLLYSTLSDLRLSGGKMSSKEKFEDVRLPQMDR